MAPGGQTGDAKRIQGKDKCKARRTKQAVGSQLLESGEKKKGQKARRGTRQPAETPFFLGILQKEKIDTEIVRFLYVSPLPY